MCSLSCIVSNLYDDLDGSIRVVFEGTSIILTFSGGTEENRSGASILVVADRCLDTSNMFLFFPKYL
jgi:hypothetical protein